MLIASQVLPKLFVLMDAARAFKSYDESINVVNVIYDSAVSFDAWWSDGVTSLLTDTENLTLVSKSPL